MSDKVTEVLNDLVETSINGEKGFQAAAEEASNPELKMLFQRRARDCSAGAAQLQALVAGMGGTPEKGGTVAGAMHRGWLSLKSTVAGRTDTAILEECERGEDLAKQQYANALKERLPDEVRAVVQRQYEGVLRNHDQIRDLRNRYQAQG